MSPATRERVLIMILPAALIVVGWWGIARPTKKLEAARSELAAALASEPKPPDFSQVQSTIASTRRDLEGVQADRREWTARWQELQQQRSSDSTDRVANIEVVTAMIDRFGLKLVGDSPAAASAPQRMPPALEEAAKRLAHEGKGGVKPQFWQIEFRGRYANVMEALGELPAVCPLAIPVQLTMNGSGDDSGVRDWTLLLWL